MSSPRVAAVRVGRILELTGDEPVRTAYRKHRVVGRVRVLREGLEGDEHAHPEVHGGADRALLAYPAAHYPAWGADGVEAGGFGENLVVEGLDERSVCIGDAFRVGTALLEVSVPRTPCRMISLATGFPDLYERVRASERTGFLLRVREEGELAEGDAMLACGRAHPEWTVERAAHVMDRMRAYDQAVVPEARELAGVTALAAGWREKLRRRADAAERGETSDPSS